MRCVRSVKDVRLEVHENGAESVFLAEHTPGGVSGRDKMRTIRKVRCLNYNQITAETVSGTGPHSADLNFSFACSFLVHLSASLSALTKSATEKLLDEREDR